MNRDRLVDKNGLLEQARATKHARIVMRLADIDVLAAASAADPAWPKRFDERIGGGICRDVVLVLMVVLPLLNQQSGVVT